MTGAVPVCGVSDTERAAWMDAARCQNCACSRAPGPLGSPLVFVEEAAENGPTLDSFPGEIGYGVVGPGWLELERAVWSSPVVMPGIFGHHAAKVSFAEEQYPAGYLRPGGEHEPFRIGVRARTPGRDFNRFDAAIG
jgi:hypothetical protein